MQFNDEETESRFKNNFEELARKLYEDFNKKLAPQHRVVFANGQSTNIQAVDGVEVSNYCKELGALVAQVSKYDWKGVPPALSAVFRHCVINGSLQLEEGVLPKIIFEDTEIKGKADFTNASFLGQVDFLNTVFEKEACFNGGTFHSTASFKKSIFRDDAEFINATFFDHANFSDVHLQKKADFNYSNFRVADFIRTKFSGTATFHESIFEEQSFFWNAEFIENADFGEVEFRKSVSFTDSKFSNNASFMAARFQRKTFFNNASFAGTTSFMQSTFSNTTYFNNCIFKATTYFSDAKFLQCPRFHEAELHQDTSFKNTSFGSQRLMAGFSQRVFSLPGIGKLLNAVQDLRLKLQPKAKVFIKRIGIGWDSEARAYRTLKLLMSKHQAQHEAAQFFAAEMRCRRRQLGLRRPVLYFVSLLYDLFSEFGQSVGRVLFVLLLANALFTLGYLQQGLEDFDSGQTRFGIVEQQSSSSSLSTYHRRWDEDYPWVALSLQSLNPVAFLSPKNTWVQVYDGAVFIEALSQSLLNLVLLILMAISLRGQFRRGSGGSD